MYQGRGIYRHPVKDAIIELLKKEIVLSVGQIARRLNRHKNQIYITLRIMEADGIVEKIKLYQPLVPEGKPIPVLYYYLKENRDKALKILKILK